MTKKKAAVEKKIKRRKEERWRLVVFVCCCKKRMILSKEFYDKCCPTYKKAIDELEKKLADNGVIRRKHEVLDMASMSEWFADFEIKEEKLCDTVLDFAAKYLTPKEYWEYAMHYFDDFIADFPLEARKKVSCTLAKYGWFHHLYYNHAWNSIDCTSNVEDGREHFMKAYDGERFKLLDFQMKDYLQQRYLHNKYDVTEKDLQYPHDRLKECFREYERTKSPSCKIVQQYQKMTALFAKIKAAEEDVEEWFKLLAEAGDDIFVMHNVECRLGQDLFNVKLWKLYIAFLKEHDKCNRLVQMYSKYCRFFLEDSDMLEEYKAELAKHGKVDVPLDKMYLLIVKEVVVKEDVTQDDEIVPFDKSICSSFYDSAGNQTFPLSQPLIEYMLENAGHLVLRKLFESCKYFFTKKPTPICYRLVNGYEEKYENESLTLRHNATLETYLNKTWVTGIIGVGYAVEVGTSFNHDFMSSVIPRLHRCEAKYINLYFQHLTFDELKFLIQHGGVIDLDISTSTIKDNKNRVVDLEQFLAHLPNVESLSLSQVKTHANTVTALSKLQFNSKIRRFNINSVFGQRFNAEDFVKFCEAIRDEKMFECFMFFVPRFNPAFVQKLKWKMEDFAESSVNCTVAINLDGDVALF